MLSFTGLLTCFAVVAVSFLLLANNGLTDTLSPQGCRMSYMSPSYVLMDSFNTSWTHLSSRYSLWLYREVGWDSQVRSSGWPSNVFLSPFLGSQWSSCLVYSWKCRLFPSSPVNSIVCCQAVLLLTRTRLNGSNFQRNQRSGFLCR